MRLEGLNNNLGN